MVGERKISLTECLFKYSIAMKTDKTRYDVQDLFVNFTANGLFNIPKWRVEGFIFPCKPLCKTKVRGEI